MKEAEGREGRRESEEDTVGRRCKRKQDFRKEKLCCTLGTNIILDVN